MAGINYKKRKRNDTILPQLFKECEILYDKFNKDLLAGKLLSLSDTAILQHYLGDDGCKLSIQKMVEMRLKLLKDPEIVILVAGEYNAGKTTFVNILMGGDYLPMGRGKKSRTVCEIRHSMQRQAIISYTDREKEIVSLTENCKDACWKRIQDIIKTDYTNEDHGVTRVVIEWPIKALKGFLLTNFNNDDDISNERTEASPPRFPSDFIDQLTQCLSKTHHQHEETGLPSAKFNSSQTFRKEVYSGLQNDPTDDSEPRMELLKEASENSTEKGNEEASLSSNSEQETPDKDTDIDQTTPKQMIDTCYDNFSDVLQDIEQFTFSFVDCPGIDSSEPESFKPSREEMMRCFTFFFIIDESQDDGFHKKGIQTFTKDVDKSFKDRKIDLRTDQLLFFANKMDIATEETQEYDVITELHDKVKQTWGLVKRSQIIPLEARKTLKGTLSKSLKQAIQDHISSCTWIWLEEQYIWLLNCLHIAYHLSLCTKPPTAMKNALAEPLKKAKTAVYEVQSELKDISEAAVNEKAWDDLKAILLTVGNLEDISWREMEVKTEVQKRIGGDRETNVDWLVLYNIICEMICEQVVMKINALGDDKKNKLYQAQSTFRKSIYKMFEAQNDRLKEAQNMLPSFKGSNQDAASNNILTSMVAPLLASLSIRGAHIFLPYFLLAAPAVPVFLVAGSVWEEWNYSNQEARREEFLRDRVAFMRKETSQILTYSKRDVNENVKISKSVLFRFIYREIDERYRLHERSEALLEMVKYLENFGDKPSDALYVNVTLRTAVTYYIEQVLDHDILPEDITGDINADQHNPIGDGDGQSKVFDASLNGTIGFAVKEFRIERASDTPDVMLGYRQCYFLRKLSNSDSDRLVKFYGTYIVKTDTDLSLRIVLKRYDGNLKDITKRPIPRDPRERLREFQHYAKECSEGVKFLHDNSTVHEDIKPTNFLLTRQPNSYDKVCITDIGGVKSLEELQFSQAGATKGARRYLAPEITTSNTGHSKASDIYCLGLVLWELWHRKSSYENIQVINNIEELTALSDELPKRLFFGSLQRNPCHRENIDTLLKIIDELKL